MTLPSCGVGCRACRAVYVPHSSSGWRRAPFSPIRSRGCILAILSPRSTLGVVGFVSSRLSSRLRLSVRFALSSVIRLRWVVRLPLLSRRVSALVLVAWWAALGNVGLPCFCSACRVSCLWSVPIPYVAVEAWDGNRPAFAECAVTFLGFDWIDGSTVR